MLSQDLCLRLCRRLALRDRSCCVAKIPERGNLRASAVHNGQGDASKCPIARMVDFGKQQLSSKSYDPDPYTSQDYQGRYRMGMGLSPMKKDEWIEIDEEYEADIELRRKLLAEEKDLVIQSLPEAEDANEELLSLLVDFLPKTFPDRFKLTVHNELENLATGDVFNLRHPQLSALEVCSLLVQEDLCLMKEDNQGVLRFVSGAVLFPQRWSLLEKLGMDMNRIHSPVPLYEEEIGRPVATFMQRLTVERPFWRCNWTVSDSPEKFQPLMEEDIEQVNAGVSLNIKWQSEPITAQNAGDRLLTRMERETLSRLPKTGAILFTIRTHMKPLSRFQKMPCKARQLARALRNLHPSITQYKTISAFRSQALDYLDGIAEADDPSQELLTPMPAHQS